MYRQIMPLPHDALVMRGGILGCYPVLRTEITTVMKTAASTWESAHYLEEYAAVRRRAEPEKYERDSQLKRQLRTSCRLTRGSRRLAK